MTSKLPNNKSHWVIAVSGLVFIAFDIYIDYFRAFDPMTANGAEFFIDWLFRVIRDASLTIALSCMTIFGIRSLRRDGFSTRRFLSPAFAVLFCLFLAILSLFGHNKISQIQRNLFDTPYSLKKNIKKCLDSKDLSLSQRSKISLMYARQVWEETGETIVFITNDGKERVYEPSPEEIEKKKKMDRTDELLNYTLKGLKRAYIFWPIVAIISVAIGFFSRIKKQT